MALSVKSFDRSFSLCLAKGSLCRQIWYRINDICIFSYTTSKVFGLMNSRKSKSFGWGIYIVQHTNTIPPFWCLKVKDNNTPTTFLYIETIRVIFIQKSVYDTVRFFQFSISKCLSSLSLKWVKNVSTFEMLLKKILKKISITWSNMNWVIIEMHRIINLYALW